MCFQIEDIEKIINDNDVEFIRLQFTDILGHMKNVAVTRSQLDNVLNNKVTFDGSSVEGFSRIEESDMYLRPDMDTFSLLPWRPKQSAVARMICDIHTPDGDAFEGDPRYRLRRAIDKAEELGYTFNVGAECEFFLFHTDEVGRPTTLTHDTSSYFDLEPLDLGGEVRRRIVLALEEMGFEIEASHHEVARGQHEVDFKYSDALKAADNIMTFKFAVKSIAKKNNLFASFMPKPTEGVNGSGMHINMSLSQNGRNVFYDPDDPKRNGLSREAYCFIAGIMKHIKAMTAVNNPLVNSYKRLVPGYEAPIHIAWSCKNRSPLIRIPASRGSGTRVELRSPDPSANPYLVLACCLEAGLDGISRGIEPPDEITENIFDMSENELAQSGIEAIPSSLEEALKELEKDELIKETLGEHILSKFMTLKKAECDEYRHQVSQWEIERYLNTY